MSEALDLKNAAENVISSYETRIESVEAMFDTAHQILDDFQGAFLDNKEEGRKINTDLRDILAHNEHLRKKDFDSMTQGALSAQEEREAEVKNLLKGYLNQQREMARTLRENLAKFKNALAKGDVQRVKEFQEMIKEVLVNQDARKEEVSSKLKGFQKEQQEMAERLKALLVKGRELRIKDLKEMLREFRIQHKERLSHQIERRKEVNKMLGRAKDKTSEAI
jgi:intein/homing endonuclease